MSLHRVPPAVCLRSRLPGGSLRLACAIAVLVPCSALGEPASRTAPEQDCKAFEQTVAAEHALGRDLAPAFAGAVERLGATCVGSVFTKLAAAASLEARVIDVERYAERSITLLETEHPPDDPILLRPLVFLSSASFELKNIAKSRRVYERLRRIRPSTPEERAIVHELSSTLLRGDGKLQDAVMEMRAAILDGEKAGRGGCADQAWFYHQLALLYVEQEQYPEARGTIARAGDILAAARDAAPLDRIQVLETEGVIYAREGDLRGAERCFAKALAIADGSPALDRSASRLWLVNYAFVLRKLGRGRDARAVERRLAALPPDPARGIVDVSQLARERAAK